MAIAIILLLTWVNTRGVKTGAAVQNTFTFAKTAALLGLIGFGFLAGRDPQAVARNFDRFWENADWTFTTVQVVGVAMVGALFSSDAWNNVTFTAGEMRNPKRNLPLSLVLGVGIVSVLYLACNFVYLNALPLEAIQTAPQDRVATAVAQKMFGIDGRAIDRRGHHGLDVRVRQRPDSGRSARLLRHGAGWAVLQVHRQPGPENFRSGHVAGVAMRVGLSAHLDRPLQRPAGLCYLRSAAVLHSDDQRNLRAPSHAARRWSGRIARSGTPCCPCYISWLLD